MLNTKRSNRFKERPFLRLIGAGIKAMKFEHERHKSPTKLSQPRSLIVACPPMRSNVNPSRIVRTAGCFGIRSLILCGDPKLDQEISRDAVDQLEIQTPRSLLPVLKKKAADGFRLVGLEQTSNSVPIYDFQFERKSVLVIGNERMGISDDILQILDDVIEIPIYGQPHSLNAASAAIIAMYEYCRQFPDG